MAHIENEGLATGEVAAGPAVAPTDEVAPQAEGDVATESTDEELDDLADVEFMLEEIEDKIAPLALA